MEELSNPLSSALISSYKQYLSNGYVVFSNKEYRFILNKQKIILLVSRILDTIILNLLKYIKYYSFFKKINISSNK